MQEFDTVPEVKEELAEGYAVDGPLRCAWNGCGSICTSAEALDLHIRIDHIGNQKEESNDNLFYCSWDGCPRGEYPFKQNYQLSQHIRGHSGFKPFVCSFPGCISSYARLENLKTHIRSKHTMERPYPCPDPSCDRVFSNCSDRNKHVVRVHAQNKRYSCTTCEKYYSDVSSLRKHVMDKHGGQAYQRWKEIRAEQRSQKRIVERAERVVSAFVHVMPKPELDDTFEAGTDEHQDISDTDSNEEIDVINPSKSFTKQLLNDAYEVKQVKLDE
ncbi:hypothetical protein QR680_011934 [Steinernema hermaphroditum]|uniref:C2H2-type domain-containing protein n=1 Tax=Steinernema hermaphroditum TaxID=289476 RepID=A0AA39LYX4_9BILA|nr:hypothetical protein QR680_011934 [Steinernema hermaphroditum]